jgi:hypothetical protein
MMDMNRLGAALARPGLDTRVNSSYAYANAESFYDAAHGVFVDVTLTPSGQVVTARVPSIYAGTGFGLYAKVHKDDELLVVLPNGEQAEGAVIVARLWSAADKPPSEAGVDPNEVMLIVEKDKHLRLKTTGGGKVEIDSEAQVTLQCDKVRLGDRDSTEQVVWGTTFRLNQKQMDQTVAAQLTAEGAAETAEGVALTAAAASIIAAGVALSAAGADPVFVALCPVAAPAVATAGAALSVAGPLILTAGTQAGLAGTAATAAGTAVTAFETTGGTKQDYLSKVSNTK